MGLLTAGHQLGAALGASVGGYLFDRYSVYDGVWLSSFALALIAGMRVFFIKDRAHASPALA
jgi:predicted MFS family arabinose efflux permease